MVRAGTGSQSVLIVDDCEDVADTLAALFDIAGWNTACAYTAPQAEEVLAVTRPDMVVCDLKMPGLDGIALVRRLRPKSEFRDTRWIAYTGVADPAVHAECLGAGFDGVLVKSGTADDLIKLLTNLGT